MEGRKVGMEGRWVDRYARNDGRKEEMEVGR